MHDSCIRRNNRGVTECRLAPAQESVALLVAQKFHLRIHCECFRRTKLIHLHRMVNHQLSRLERIDERGIAAQFRHGVAHRGEIHNGGNAGEVLHEHSAGRESDLLFGFRFAVPRRQRANIVGFYVASVFGAQQVFKQNAQGEREMLRRDPLVIKSIQPKYFVFFTANFESGMSMKAIHDTAFLVSFYRGDQQISLVVCGGVCVDR